MKTGKLAQWLFAIVASASLLFASEVTSTISGRLVDPAQTPVAGVEVLASDLFGHLTTNTTSGEGMFTFSLPTGHWTIYVEPAQTPGFLPPALSFDLGAPTNYTNITAKLLPADAAISGQVLSPAGAPVEGVRIYATRSISINDIPPSYLTMVKTDTEGKYALTASKGEWFVFAECSDLLSLSFDCVRGTNVDASSGSATADFSLTTGPQPTIEQLRMEVMTFPVDPPIYVPTLIFTLRGAPGGYDIQARFDIPPYKYSWPDIDFVAIPAGSETAEVRINVDSYPELAKAQFFRVRRRLASP